MRKITRDAIMAFAGDIPFKRGNTEVKVREEQAFSGTTVTHSDLYLHGNKIATKMSNGDIWITNAGYFTTVTKERLNGLPYSTIKQKDGVWYLNNKEWDGEWVNSRTYNNF